MSKKIEADKAVVRKMIELYARHHAGQNELQGEYLELAKYCERRLDRCRWGERKPACRDCPVHCYSPERRQQIIKVMRWAGPRMLFYAPKASLEHLWSKLSTALKARRP